MRIIKIYRALKPRLIVHGMHKVPLRLLYSVISYKSLTEPLQPLSWSKKQTIPLQILIKEPHSVLSECDSSRLSFLYLTHYPFLCPLCLFRGIDKTVYRTPESSKNSLQAPSEVWHFTDNRILTSYSKYRSLFFFPSTEGTRTWMYLTPQNSLNRFLHLLSPAKQNILPINSFRSKERIIPNEQWNIQHEKWAVQAHPI